MGLFSIFLLQFLKRTGYKLHGNNEDGSADYVFHTKNVKLTFFLDYKNIYRAESTFDKGNIQHVKRNFFRE